MSAQVLQVHINDFKAKNIVVRPVKADQRPNKADQLCVCYDYGGGKIAPLQLCLESAMWSAPQYFAQNRMCAIDPDEALTAQSVSAVGVNLFGEGKWAATKLDLSTNCASEKALSAVQSIVDAVCVVLKHYGIKYADLSGPLREYNGVVSLRAKLRIVLVDSLVDREAIPLSQCARRIEEGKPVAWCAPDLGMYDAKEQWISPLENDYLKLMRHGFEGKTIIRFGRLQPYGKQCVSCSGALIGVCGTFGFTHERRVFGLPEALPFTSVVAAAPAAKHSKNAPSNSQKSSNGGKKRRRHDSDEENSPQVYPPWEEGDDEFL